MNRADKRSMQREIQKAAKTINKLNPNQVKLIDKITTERANEQIEAALVSYQRVINASLFEHGFSNNQVEGIFNVANELMKDESVKGSKLSEELRRSGNIEMAKKKIEVAIVDSIKELISGGKTRKEIIDEMLFKFPSMSKAMIINAYAQVKEELKEDKSEDSEIKQAVEYIFEDENRKVTKEQLEKWDKQYNAGGKLAEEVKEIERTEKIKEGEKEMNNKVKEEVKTDVIVKGATVTAANLSPEIEKSKLKIKSMVVEGENGTYKVCENAVELSKDGLLMVFENPEQLDNFYKEYKQVFTMIK